MHVCMCACIFFSFIQHLYKDFPETVIELVPLIPHYGSFKDLFQILNRIGEVEDYIRLQDRIIQVVVEQLVCDDKQVLNITTIHLTLRKVCST
jgi:hypothetical protein